MTPTRPPRAGGGRGGPATAGRTARGPGRAYSEPPSSRESDSTAPPRPLAAAVWGEKREMTVHHRRGEAAAGGTQASSAASGYDDPFGDTQVSY